MNIENVLKDTPTAQKFLKEKLVISTIDCESALELGLKRINCAKQNCLDCPLMSKCFTAPTTYFSKSKKKITELPKNPTVMTLGKFIKNAIDMQKVKIEKLIKSHIPTWQKFIAGTLAITSTTVEEDELIQDFFIKLDFDWWTGEKLGRYYPSNDLEKNEKCVSYFVERDGNKFLLNRFFRSNFQDTLTVKQFIKVVKK